jgi:hypothetical protein
MVTFHREGGIPDLRVEAGTLQDVAFAGPPHHQAAERCGLGQVPARWKHYPAEKRVLTPFYQRLRFQ